MRHHELEIAVDVPQQLLPWFAPAVQRRAGLLPKLAKQCGQRETVQLFLARKVVVEQRLIHTRGPCNRPNARAGQAPLGKILLCRAQNALYGAGAPRMSYVPRRSVPRSCRSW